MLVKIVVTSNVLKDTSLIQRESYRRRAKIYQDLGKKKEALLDLEHKLIINPHFCDVIEESIQFSSDENLKRVKKSQIGKLNTEE
jgi:hypothetical protein